MPRRCPQHGIYAMPAPAAMAAKSASTSPLSHPAVRSRRSRTRPSSCPEVSVSAALMLGLASSELAGLLALQTDADIVDLDLAICYILWDLDCEIVIFDLNADILGCFCYTPILQFTRIYSRYRRCSFFLQGVLAVSVYCYYTLIAARIDYCSTCSDISFANRCLIRHCTGDADLSDDFLTCFNIKIDFERRSI